MNAYRMTMSWLIVGCLLIGFTLTMPVPASTLVNIMGIDVFDAATQLIDKTRGDQDLAIDGDFNTFSFLTPPWTVDPFLAAINFDGIHSVNRLRVAKTQGGVDLNPLDIDSVDLEILFTTGTDTDLAARSYTRVTGLSNGFMGTEMINAASVNSNGTITGDIHDPPSGDPSFWSVTFNPVFATGFALRVDNTDIGGFDHYPVREFQIFAIPEPGALLLSALATVGLLMRRRSLR